MEYLATGKPVIAPDTSGILDYFSRDELFLFECGSRADLAAQILRVHANPQLALQVTEKGQQVYLSHTWSKERRTLVDSVSRLLLAQEATQVA